MGDSRPAASVCIVVLCGLPGSGKTTFSRSFAEAENAQQLLQLAGRPVRVWHVCYDRVEEELGGAGQSVLAFDVQNWQESRLVAMQKLSCLLLRSRRVQRHDNRRRPGVAAANHGLCGWPHVRFIGPTLARWGC